MRDESWRKLVEASWTSEGTLLPEELLGLPLSFPLDERQVEGILLGIDDDFLTVGYPSGEELTTTLVPVEETTVLLAPTPELAKFILALEMEEVAEKALGSSTIGTSNERFLEWAKEWGTQEVNVFEKLPANLQAAERVTFLKELLSDHIGDAVPAALDGELVLYFTGEEAKLVRPDSSYRTIRVKGGLRVEEVKGAKLKAVSGKEGIPAYLFGSLLLLITKQEAIYTELGLDEIERASTPLEGLLLLTIDEVVERWEKLEKLEGVGEGKFSLPLSSWGIE